MSNFLKVIRVIGCFVIASSFLAEAALPPLQQSLINPPGSHTTPPSKPAESPVPQTTPLAPPKVLPLMEKPFGMPGVVGFQNGMWQGTDYLGYLSSNISINVEIVAGNNLPKMPDTAILEGEVNKIFTKENLVSHAQVTEGPPLPFLHILLFIYPVDKNRFAIFGTARLFEQVQVVRKNFTPAGYWQAITWETQDVMLAEESQLNAEIIAIVNKLSTAFVKRYRMYNLNPGTQPPAMSGMPTIPST